MAAVAALVAGDPPSGPVVTGVPDLRPPTPPGDPAPAPAPPADAGDRPEPRAAIRWRHSRAIGLPHAGRLRAGVLLPAAGAHFETWDPIRRRRPNRAWRRWGTDRLVRTVLRVLTRHARDHPGAPPVLVGDLSRRHGGDFGPRFGGIGHASHQNGLDADVYYPRRDGRLRAARRPVQVDRRAAQELVDAFVAAGAQFVFVGPHVGLTGRPRVVQPLRHHDDHLHVRLRP